MNKLQNFNFSGQDVRIITINDEPWFVVADIAKVLGASNSRSLAQMVDEEDKGKQSLHSGSDATIVNESTYVHNSGKIIVTKTPKVTGKGQIYFVNKFLQDLANEIDLAWFK